jgi:hypothetical protein
LNVNDRIQVIEGDLINLCGRVLSVGNGTVTIQPDDAALKAVRACTMLLCTMLLCTMLLCTMLLCTMLRLPKSH